MVRNFWPIWIMLFYVFFCNIIKVKLFLYYFITLLELISSLLHTKSLFIPYTYGSIESIDCIILRWFELKAILLISSVKRLCFSLLSLCCVFNIIFWFFMNSFWSSLRLSISILFCSKWCILFSVGAVSTQFL